MGDSIILIGPQACGKTKVGESLAGLLNVPFMDADDLFVEKYGPINKFTEINTSGLCEEGIEYLKMYRMKLFRRAESEIILPL